MSYKPKDQFFPTLVEGNVRQSGGSLTLGVGELAFVDLSRSTKAQGAKVLNDFAPLPPDAKLAIRMGEPNDYISRSESNKSIASIPFKLTDVVNIYVDAPERPGVKVDDFVVGFNGEAGTEIVLDNAENEVIDFIISNGTLGMIGLKDKRHTVSINLTAPLDGDIGVDWTMEEIMENVYLELKNYKLPGNVPVTEFVDVMLVNSENPTTLPGTAVNFYNLVLEDDGTQSDLGAVQAQYPSLDVKQVTSDGGVSTYTVIGTAPPSAFQLGSKFLLKGCDACPVGYTNLAQGAVYQVVIEDLAGITPAAQLALVQALPGATVGTALLNETVGDVNTYSVVLSDPLTDAEVATFIGANPTASVTLVSENVSDLCASPTPSTVVWTVGETCNATTQAYTITLADGECGESRLAELQLAYPELTVTEVVASEAGCQRSYQTTLTTSLVCEECDPIFRDIFESEELESYDAAPWVKANRVYNPNAKMGIRIRGKRSTLSGNEFLRDDMPFVDTSVDISIAGGYQEYLNVSYLAGTNGAFNVKQLSRKADAQNLGGNLRKFEEEAQVNFRGRSRYTSNFSKLVTGQESRLVGLEQYIVYSVTIAPHSIASNFQQPQIGAYTYHFTVPMGKQGKLETILNKLASAAKLPLVQAVSK